MNLPTPPPKRLHELLDGVRLLSPVEGDVTLGHVTDHSGEVTPSSLFVAVKGYSTDGHRFIEQAVSNGAVAVVHQEGTVPPPAISVLVSDSRKALSLIARNFYGNPQKELGLVGVTGTNGKTTIVHMITFVLDRLGVSNALIGTVGHRIAGMEIEASHTTPSALELWRLIALAARRDAKVVVMEVSSHALEMERVFGLEFDCSVFTNLTQDHLDFHGNMDGYFKAKSRLFTRFTTGSSVVNVDDPYGRRLLDLLDSALGYGLADPIPGLSGGFWGRLLRTDASGLDLKIPWKGEEHLLNSPLVGRHNAYNLLAAFGALHSMGFNSREIATALSEFPGVRGRLERVETGHLGFSVFVDYAHTPHALESVIKALLPVTRRELWVVFGCGGDRDRGKRSQMGRIAASLAHKVVVTSDNPRSEQPEAIIGEIMAGVGERGKVVVEPDRKKAIFHAIEHAQEGDVVLIAGKGHETYQIFADRTIHFDDAEEARAAIAKRTE